MSIVDTVVNAFKRAFRRKAEKEINKAVDKVVDDAIDKQLKKEGVEIKTTDANGNVKEGAQALRQEEPVNITINVNDSNSNAGKAAANFAQAQEIMKYLILDKDNNVIGVTEDAPDYLKNAYNNGEFNK